MNVKSPHVFFSYSRNDAQFVLNLATDLRSAGINLWIDQLDIVAGDRWDHAVEAALENAPCLLVVLSPDSVASQNVMDEVSFGLEKNKTIVPVLLRSCDIPFRLRRFHYIDFTIEYPKSFSQLLATLTRHSVSDAHFAPDNVPEEMEKAANLRIPRQGEENPSNVSLADNSKKEITATDNQEKPITASPKPNTSIKIVSFPIIFTIIFIIAAPGSFYLIKYILNDDSGDMKKITITQITNEITENTNRRPLRDKQDIAVQNKEKSNFFMTRIITDEDLRGKSSEELNLMSNELGEEMDKTSARIDKIINNNSTSISDNENIKLNELINLRSMYYNNASTILSFDHKRNLKIINEMK